VIRGGDVVHTGDLEGMEELQAHAKSKMTNSL
jgi:hypothetical protein